jgi:DNA-binding CsgD family transcriptional regulator
MLVKWKLYSQEPGIFHRATFARIMSGCSDLFLGRVIQGFINIKPIVKKLTLRWVTVGSRILRTVNSLNLVYLTPRQRQILALAALEYTTEDIARLIDREPKTVESHLTSIYQKFHVHSRIGAIVKAVRLGELPSDSGKLLELVKLDEGAP